MAKRKSLTRQICERFEHMQAFGESRHEAKQDGTAKDKIFSYETYKSYQERCIAFGNYCKAEYGVRETHEITREMAIGWIESNKENRSSAWTQQLDKSAVNKAFDFNLKADECGIRDRRNDEITRGRELSESHLKAIQREDMQEQITIGQAFGIRRQSMLKIQKDDFKRDENGVLRVSVIEKGGREREARCLASREEEVLRILESKSDDGPIFEKFDKNINNHAYRAEYACNLYKELEPVYAECAEKWKEFNLAACQEVSQNLGHNRLNVLNNYFHKM